MSRWDREVPFVDGAMQEWVDDYGTPYGQKPTKDRWNNREIVWEKTTEFEAVLKLKSWGRGRSSVRYYFEDVSRPGRSYSMAVAAFYDALQAFNLNNGYMKGRFTFRKQGSNYGLYPVVGKEDNDGKPKVISEEELEAALDKEQADYQAREDGPL